MRRLPRKIDRPQWSAYALPRGAGPAPWESPVSVPPQVRAWEFPVPASGRLLRLGLRLLRGFRGWSCPGAGSRRSSFPEAFAAPGLPFLLRGGRRVLRFLIRGRVLRCSQEWATTESVPGREHPACMASLEVQAHTSSSFSRERVPPLAPAKTKTIRCRDSARSWPEMLSHQKASPRLPEILASQEPGVWIVRLAAGVTVTTRPSGRAVWRRPVCRLLNDSRAPRSRR